MNDDESTKEAKRALRGAQKVLRRRTDDLSAWRELAMRAVDAGDRPEAARGWIEVARLLEKRGAYGGALRALGRAHRSGGDVTGARVRVRRRWGIAWGAALLSALLMAAGAPRLDLWPLGLIALVPLYLVVRSMNVGPALLYGWVCGVLINAYGFAWGVPLLGNFGGVAPLPALGIVLAVCAYQAVVFGIWAGGSALLARRLRVPWLLGAPLLIVVAEAAVPFLFPWYLGVTIWRAWPLLQVAELGGPPAVSALVVLINLVLAEAGLAWARREPQGRSTKIAALVAATVVALGLVRAGHVAWLRARAPHMRAGVLQPNFGTISVEDRKLRGQKYIETLRTETDELGRRGAELVVWPESAFPYPFDRQLTREFSRANPAALRSEYKGYLLVGALTHTFGTGDVYNSALLDTPDGRIAGRYDKVRLMPFGEYVPFADRYPDWAGRVRKAMPESSDIKPGTASAVLSDGPLRIAPMICYEDILTDTGEDVGRQRPGANLLVTLANHSWFGTTLVPREALALATLRSVELRRDLVRATNTGVSSIGDALGRVQVEGSLQDVPNPGKPELLLGEVALLEAGALGPYGAPLFPYVCGVALGICAVAMRKRS